MDLIKAMLDTALRTMGHKDGCETPSCTTKVDEISMWASFEWVI